MLLFGAFVVAVIIYWILAKWKSTALKFPLPPGPRGIPFLGNLLQMGKYPHLQFSNWAKTYGDIYKVQLGTTDYLIVSDAKAVREIFSGDPVFAGRQDFKWFDLHDDGPSHGIINTDGDNWEQLRRFTLRQLRDFGFGKNTMETLIMEEVNELVEWIQGQKGQPCSGIKERFSLAVVNSLWRIMTGKRYSHDDPKLINLTSGFVDAFGDVFERGALLLFMPSLKNIIPELSGFNRVRQFMKTVRQFIEEAVTEHKTTYSEDHSRDFIDAFLKEMKQSTDSNSPFLLNGEKQLMSCLSDLFMAGSDTTSTALSWTILCLSRFRDKQDKLLREINKVVGNSRQVSLSDRHSMPFTEALIAEVLRFSSIVPTGAGHRALATREFRGYTIPKDTVIMPNLYHIHLNPDVWGDPEEFRPERFLNENETCFKKHEALLSFSIGRRVCLGESLARDTLFLFITNIFQTFSITFDPKEEGHVDLHLECIPGFVLHPKPLNVIAKARAGQT